MKYIKDAISASKDVSSARVINLLGAVSATVLLGFDTVYNASIRIEAFGMYLAYCAGVYGYGKKLDKENNGTDK